MKDEYLDLEQILEKIYFDQYSYDELKEFVFPALREIPNINSFFDILFNSIRLYSEVSIKNYCLRFIAFDGLSLGSEKLDSLAAEGDHTQLLRGG